jgi:hypothetical protein
MKYLIAVLALLSGGITQAMFVKLPDAATLKTRFNAMMLDDFIEKTKLDQQLGGIEILPIRVAIAVEKAFSTYRKQVNPADAERLQTYYPKIIEALLQDSPAAIQELKEYGLLNIYK